MDDKLNTTEIIDAKWCIYVSVIQPSLVQMMAFRPVRTKSLFERILE